jgi:hypothetical protein
VANHQKTISPAQSDRFLEGVGRVVLDMEGEPVVVFRFTPVGGA